MIQQIKNSYTYIYLDPRKSGTFNYINEEYDLKFDYEPFYIGKGTNNRCNEGIKYSLKNKSHKCHKSNKIKNIFKENLKPIIIKIFENISEKEAYEHEIKLIKIIGRTENNGPLTNLAPGGEGGGSKHTKEWKDKLSKPVLQFDLQGNLIKRFTSTTEAGKELNNWYTNFTCVQTL